MMFHVFPSIIRAQVARRAPLGAYPHLFEVATLDEAFELMKQLQYLVDRYGSATASDVYDLVGLGHKSTFVDSKSGWTNFVGTEIKMSANGWQITFPRATYIP
jgi:hypothetical protein